MLRSFIKRVSADKRGNILMMTGFAIIPLVGAVGLGVDYSRAARIDTKLSAAADAAALAAVSRPMMLKSETEAKAYARAIFVQQASTIPDLVYDVNDIDITISHTGSVAQDRTVAISFKGQSKNLFGRILGLDKLNVGGSVNTFAAVAPNIDFYLLLDTSPSMALPVTSAGATEMSNMVGCQFACHSNAARDHGIYVYDNNTTKINKSMNADIGDGRTQIDSEGTYVKGADIFNADGTYVDSYWLARNKGIILRIDAERIAASSLMAYAKAQALTNGATYRAGVHTFDYKENVKTIASLTSNLDSVASSASGIELLGVNRWNGGWGCPSKKNEPVFCNDFRETSYTGALTKMNTEIANPGNGTNAVGDTPKKYLFIVTDGISDEEIINPAIWRTRTEMHDNHIDLCKAIKDRGITIAILYTVYTPESISNDGQQGIDVTARLPFVLPKLKQCATSPDLVYSVSTNGDISKALKDLFDRATATARLIR